MPRPLRILCYAINGTGVGHLSRLVAMASEARLLGAAMGQKLDVQFLTTSEAPQIAAGFPVYKLPSKTIVNATDTNVDRFRRSAKLIVANLTATLQPDLLVMDTVPEGSYREFVFLKDYAGATLFVDRHKDRRHADDATHRSHLALYDRILVPDDAAREAEYPLPAKLSGRRRFLGPVHGAQVALGLSATEMKAELGIPSDRRVAYLSAGGGGDASAEVQIDRLLEALLAIEDLHVIVGYGPLFRGRKRYGPRLTTFAEPGVQRFFAGVDFAISAAGYNSYHELLAARTPTLFFAQDKGMDRQDLRVALGVEHGWHLGGVDRLAVDDTVLLDAVRRIADPAVQDELRSALDARTAARGASGALLGGFYWLDLLSAQPQVQMEREALHAALVLRHAQLRGVATDDFGAVAGLGYALRQGAPDPGPREEFIAHSHALRSGSSLGDAGERGARQILQLGAELLGIATELGGTAADLRALLSRYAAASSGDVAVLERRFVAATEEFRRRLEIAAVLPTLQAASTCVRAPELADFLDQLLNESEDEAFASAAARLRELAGQADARHRPAATCWRAISSPSPLLD